MKTLPTVDIKGKLYVMVKDRILHFNEIYPKGSIKTELLSSLESQLIVVKATVFPGDERMFTGHSQATIGDGYINKSAALENAETSAVGRALAMMGIGVLESVAGADEVVKAQNASKAPYKSKSEPTRESFEDDTL